MSQVALNAPEYLTISAEGLAERAGKRLVVLPDRAAVYEHFARSIADEIKANDEAGRRTALILPVGPLGGYPALARVCNAERISWRQVHTFNMDEYLDWEGRPLPEGHPLSFVAFMQRFFAQLDPALRPPPSQTHFPEPADPDAIGRAMEAAGGVDTCYGGVGIHGHLAFNEPPLDRWRTCGTDEFRRARTRVLPLAPETVVMNCIRTVGGHFASLPPMCITLGMAECLGARRIRLYCDGGEWQRTALRTALLGPVGVEYPVTLTQDHPDCVFICDAVTAQPAVSPERTLWDMALAAAGAS
ncbi:MAG: glucosamine-6-phosphate isomerase [Chloroflexi bacterium]|nr:glucosamine-6-phosphate isomerase [Chloroflexota bacterium]